MEIDDNKKRLVHDGKVFRARPFGYAIAVYLSANPETPRTLTAIYSHLRAAGFPVNSTESVKSHIRSLRRGLEDAYGSSRWIVSQYGFGYYWQPDDEKSPPG